MIIQVMIRADECYKSYVFFFFYFTLRLNLLFLGIFIRCGGGDDGDGGVV